MLELPAIGYSPGRFDTMHDPSRFSAAHDVAVTSLKIVNHYRRRNGDR